MVKYINYYCSFSRQSETEECQKVLAIALLIEMNSKLLISAVRAAPSTLQLDDRQHSFTAHLESNAPLGVTEHLFLLCRPVNSTRVHV